MACLTRALLLPLAAMTIAASPALAQYQGLHVTVSPYAGSGLWTDDLNVDAGVLTGARAGIMIGPWFGVEGTYGLAPTQTTTSAYETNMEHLGADVVLNLLSNRRLVPYLLGGWTQLTFDSESANVEEGGTPYVSKGWEYGAGLKYRLVEGRRMGAQLRFDARDVVTDLVQWFPNASEDHHNVMLSLGVQLSFGGSSSDSDGDGVVDRADACPSTPEGARVASDGCAIDADADGVADGLDQCASTPAGAIVDASGCPSDADRDGVYDGVDQCADTPWGSLVNYMGCTVDTDEDGIADGLDRCEDTPVGAVVDNVGCPGDADTDGVFDGLDLCDATPAGAVVDGKGCPLDADSDGVFDGLDVCANTPSGLVVDPTGCPIEITERMTEFLDTGMIRSSQIRFESGSAKLRPGSYAVLEEIGDVLVQWPDLRIEVSGHTDAIGSDEANQSLSEARAQTVLDYLVARFPSIRVGQFTVKGYGEVNPVATNETSDGRSANRRVEFLVLNREQLQRVTETRQAMREETP